MASGSSMLAAAGWFSILAGVVVTAIGIGLICLMLFGGGVPVGGAGPFVVLTLGAGPLLMLAGPGVVYAAVRLMGGYGWARSALEIFFWIVFAAAVLYIGYSASRIRGFELGDFVSGGIFFAVTGAPSIGLALVLRSESVVRAMVR